LIFVRALLGGKQSAYLAETLSAVHTLLALYVVSAYLQTPFGARIQTVLFQPLQVLLVRRGVKSKDSPKMIEK
jgi:hypothetical protein